MSTTTALQEIGGGSLQEAAPAAGYLPSGAESEGVGFQDVMRVVRQRKVTIVVTTIITYMLVCAATYVVYRYFPQYPSEAMFQLDPPESMKLLRDPSNNMINPDFMAQMLQTEANKLRGANLLLEVAGMPDVQKTRYFDWYDRDVAKTVEGLRKDLIAVPIPDTQLIRLVLATRDKEESRLIVANLARRYTDSFKNEAQRALTDQATNLKNVLSERNAELEQKRKALALHRQTSDAPSLESQRIISAEHIAKLMTQIAEQQSTTSAVQAKIDSLAGIDPSQIPLTAEHQIIIESDPLLRYLRSTVESLDVQLRVTKLQFGEQHRIIRQIEEQRQGYFEKEIAKREELTDQVRYRQLENLRDEHRQRINALAQLEESLRGAESQQRDLDKSIQAALQMEQDIESLQKLIEAVETDYQIAKSAVADTSRARLHLVQDPRPAVKPTQPNLYVFLGGGAALALLVGFAVAFLREFTDKRIRTPIDVARFGHLSVLGSVPLLDDEEAEIDTMEEAVRVAPHSVIAEAFRKVRTNLQFSGPRETQRTLLITSPSPGDGKTAIAINLAVTMAHSNQRVLLIDCNFRRPAVRERFANTRPEGLSNVLTNQSQPEDVITATDLPNLYVMTAGPMPPRPAELLGAQKMHDMLARLTESEVTLGGQRVRFDRVLLDGPPSLLISDALVLAMQVDGVLVVARADTNAKGALKRAREQLEAVNARVVGAVLNGVRARAGGYYKQQYRDYYEYTSDDVVPPDLPGLPGPDEIEKKV
ncbi:MAG: polysaccharide biosynthesis tyrosine autokinase [Planctomycetes bacterium]|nr:polysaccharide biosynthesis tyrosine autokinase [Planctomycetota bacterium]